MDLSQAFVADFCQPDNVHARMGYQMAGKLCLLGLGPDPKLRALLEAPELPADALATAQLPLGLEGLGPVRCTYWVSRCLFCRLES